jgi:hypothetical protein
MHEQQHVLVLRRQQNIHTSSAIAQSSTQTTPDRKIYLTFIGLWSCTFRKKVMPHRTNCILPVPSRQIVLPKRAGCTTFIHDRFLPDASSLLLPRLSRKDRRFYSPGNPRPPNRQVWSTFIHDMTPGSPEVLFRFSLMIHKFWGRFPLYRSAIR